MPVFSSDINYNIEECFDVIKIVVEFSVSQSYNNDNDKINIYFYLGNNHTAITHPTVCNIFKRFRQCV